MLVLHLLAARADDRVADIGVFHRLSVATLERSGFSHSRTVTRLGQFWIGVSWYDSQ